MNITRLNTLNDYKVIIKKEGGNGGGSGSNYKYYDCLMDNSKNITHEGYFPDFVKAFYVADGIIEIAPEAMGKRIAVAFDMSKRMYIDGKWVDAKTFFEERENFDFSVHPEITEEEFYHIPQDEVWTLNTQEDYKTAWNKLYPLVERYGADYIYKNKLLLALWYKSLTLESEWGTITPTEISEYRSGLNGESNEDAIQFDGCALIKRYEDEGITYHLSIYES